MTAMLVLFILLGLGGGKVLKVTKKMKDYTVVIDSWLSVDSLYECVRFSIVKMSSFHFHILSI